MDSNIIVAKCKKTGKTYGMRIEKRRNSWIITWAFPISEKEVLPGKHGKTTLYEYDYNDDELPSCPHCGSASFVKCSVCGEITCCAEEESITCQWCKTKIDAEISSGPFQIRSGEY